MFCLSNVHVLPVKRARLERKTTRKEVCAERLLPNGNTSTDEDPSLQIESSAVINLRGVSTKLHKYIVFTMQTYKKLIYNLYGVYQDKSFISLKIRYF